MLMDKKIKTQIKTQIEEARRLRKLAVRLLWLALGLLMIAFGLGLI